jgi:hypothetical protein
LLSLLLLLLLLLYGWKRVEEGRSTGFVLSSLSSRTNISRPPISVLVNVSIALRASSVFVYSTIAQPAVKRTKIQKQFHQKKKQKKQMSQKKKVPMGVNNSPLLRPLSSSKMFANFTSPACRM